MDFFFFWGYVKSQLYRGEAYASLDELRAAIERKVRAVPLKMIVRTINEGYANRLRACVDRGGRQVEPY